MKNILIIDLQTLEVVHYYKAETPKQESFGGPWGSDELTLHLECPEELDPKCVSAIMEDSEIVIVEDEEKLQAKEEKLLETLRKERNKKLASCDWTQLHDAPLSVEKKEEWMIYRQELRDLPETVEDLSNVQWPEEP